MAGTVKECSKCQRTLSLESFYKKASGRLGRAAACIDCTKAITALYKQRFPEQTRERSRRYNYAKHNLTIEQWDQMFANQGGKCAICGDENTAERNLHIDHDHECCPGTYSCGKCIRGLLCTQCNTALGLANDDVDRLMQMASYLISRKTVTTISL